MIEDDPRDTDKEWPLLLKREIACILVGEMVADEDTAQRLWNRFIAPLYDVLHAQGSWPRLRCRHCSAYHPHHPEVVSGLKRRTEHIMRCPKYVGPLEHRSYKARPGPSGTWRLECECGGVFEEGPDARCPDHDVDWRGPKTP